jgi:tripartite-type tricarboxylate transporter receptor subunit TctC
MQIRQLLRVIAGAVIAVSVSTFAQDVPRGPMRIVVPFPPGAATDAVTRMIATQLASRLGINVIVENKAGANTIIATEFVARALPDGNTLLLTISSHTSNVAVYKRLPYDTEKDFASIGLVGATPSLIAINPSVPAKNVAELLSLARTSPSVITFGTAGHGSPPHLAGEMLSAKSGAKMVHVPYKGGALAMNDVLAGHVPMLIGGLPTIASNVKAGKLRAIAVTTARRSPVMPDIPTLAESGFPGFDAGIWYGLMTSARTPQTMVQRINKALNEALADPEFRKQLVGMGIEPIGGSTQEMDALIRREIQLWSSLVEQAGIQRIE